MIKKVSSPVKSSKKSQKKVTKNKMGFTPLKDETSKSCISEADKLFLDRYHKYARLTVGIT